MISAPGQRLTIYEWPSHDRFTSTQRTNVEACINVCIGPQATQATRRELVSKCSCGHPLQNFVRLPAGGFGYFLSVSLYFSTTSSSGPARPTQTARQH